MSTLFTIHLLHRFDNTLSNSRASQLTDPPHFDFRLSRGQEYRQRRLPLDSFPFLSKRRPLSCLGLTNTPRALYIGLKMSE